MSIGHRLRQEREARGLTQLAVAALVDASERTVNDWERDVSSPKAAVLAALAAQGFDVHYVVTGLRDRAGPPPLTAEEQTLLDRWRDASRDVKNAAMGALLGGSARKGASQTFMGPVGNITQGSAPVHRVEVHMAPGQYTPKRPARKRPGKP